jgi:RNA polymerase sigma factor (sigma-70 family)
MHAVSMSRKRNDERPLPSADVNAALGAQCKREGPQLVATARKHGAGQDSEDAVQEAFLTVLLNRDYDSQAKGAGGFVQKTVEFKAMAIQARAGARYALPALDIDLVPADENASPLEILMASEERARAKTQLDRLAAAIEKLTPKRRAMAILYVLGFAELRGEASVDDEKLVNRRIAALLGLKGNAVRQRLFNTRVELRKGLR